MQSTIQISTPSHNYLYEITMQVEAMVVESKVKTGLVNDCVHLAAAVIVMLSLVKYSGVHFYYSKLFVF